MISIKQFFYSGSLILEREEKIWKYQGHSGQERFQ